jgi:hypothetical protein
MLKKIFTIKFYSFNLRVILEELFKMLRITILHPSLRLSTEAPGKESATKKRGVERHCNRSSSSCNHVRKKGGGRSPLSTVFSLHSTSFDVHDTVTRGTCFSGLSDLRAGGGGARPAMSGGERSSTGDRWALDVEEEGADGVSSGPRSEVGASHRTTPVPLITHGEGQVSGRGGLIRVNCRSSRQRQELDVKIFF